MTHTGAQWEPAFFGEDLPPETEVISSPMFAPRTTPPRDFLNPRASFPAGNNAEDSAAKRTSQEVEQGTPWLVTAAPSTGDDGQINRVTPGTASGQNVVKSPRTPSRIGVKRTPKSSGKKTKVVVVDCREGGTDVLAKFRKVTGTGSLQNVRFMI